MDRFQRFISRKLKVNRKIVIACLYIILVSFIGTTLYKYLPVLTIQISQLIYQFKLFFKIHLIMKSLNMYFRQLMGWKYQNI